MNRRLNCCFMVMAMISLLACGDDDRRTASDSGVGSDAQVRVDAQVGVDGGVEDTSSPDAGPKDLPEAVTTSGGVLTAYPLIDYLNQDRNFRVLSVNFVTTVDDDSRGDLVEVFAELENLQARESCNFFPTFRLDGVDLLGVMEAPPHFPEFGSTVPTDCIPAGGRGILKGLARGINPATAGVLAIDANPDDFQRYTRASIEPGLTQMIVEEAGLYRVEGRMTPHINLRNYGVRVFARDERNLIIAQLLAFPGDLGNLSGGVSIPYATTGVECAFEAAYVFQSWIQETSTTSSVREGSEWHRRIAERRRAQDALR